MPWLYNWLADFDLFCIGILQRTLIDAAAKIQKVYRGPNEAVRTNSAPPFLLPPQMSQSSSQTMPGAVAQRETMMRPPAFAQDRMNVSSVLNLTNVSGVPPALGNAPLVPAAYRPQPAVQNASISAETSSRPLRIDTPPQYPVERQRQTLNNPAYASLQFSRMPVNSGASPRAAGQPFLPTRPANTGAINNTDSSHLPSHVSRWPANISLPGCSPYQLPLTSFKIIKLSDLALRGLTGKPEELRALKEPYRSIFWFVLLLWNYLIK